MLIGQYTVKLGEKGRVLLPKKFRSILGERVIVTLGFEGSIMIVAQSSWQSLIKEMVNKSFLQVNIRDIQRYLLGGATEVELDKIGRFVIPEYLRKFGEIKNEIVFVGVERYVEMWDEKKWNEHQTKINKGIEEIAASVMKSLGDDHE